MSGAGGLVAYSDSDSGPEDDLTAKAPSNSAPNGSSTAQPSSSSLTGCAGGATGTPTNKRRRISAPPHAATSAAPQPQRTRSFPSAVGNWPTHVCIAFPHTVSLAGTNGGASTFSNGTDEEDEEEEIDTQCKRLALRVRERLAKATHRTIAPASLNGTNTNTMLDGGGIQSLPSTCTTVLAAVRSQHISLSRTVVLRKHQIDGFLMRLKHHLSTVRPFFVEFGGLEQYYNDEGTRGFAGWVCRRGKSEVCRLVDGVDAALQEFDMPPFYEERSVHASLVSWLTEGEHVASDDAYAGTNDGCTANNGLTGRKGSDGLTGGSHHHSSADGSEASVSAATQAAVLESILRKAALPTKKATLNGCDRTVLAPQAFHEISDQFDADCEAEGVPTGFLVSAVYCSIGNQRHELTLAGT
jgi:hypothetical protein